MPDRRNSNDPVIDLRRAQATGEAGSPDEMVSGGPVMMTESQGRGAFRTALKTGTIGLIIGLLVGAIMPFGGIEFGIRVGVGAFVGLLAGMVAGYIGGAFQSEIDGGVDDIARDPEFKESNR